jgi:hypothetical protein
LTKLLAEFIQIFLSLNPGIQTHPPIRMNPLNPLNPLFFRPGAIAAVRITPAAAPGCLSGLIVRASV